MEALLSRGLIPEKLIRWGIKQHLRKRIRDVAAMDISQAQENLNQIMEALRLSPIALKTDQVYRQFDEMPPYFFQLVMGKWLKYSCGLWTPKTANLTEAEENMLRLYIKRAEICNGMRVLDLGCGWGAFSLFAASRMPALKLTAVSNCSQQISYIKDRAEQMGLKNIHVITQDINDLELEQKFDRVISIEMFEHLRNYEELLARIAHWLTSEGKLFVQMFTHRELSYLFDEHEASDWLSRNFFAGGMIPSDHLLFYFNKDLRVQKHWLVNGQHYQKTAEAWLQHMKEHEDEILRIFRIHFGQDEAKWRNFWKIYFMSCAELGGFRSGNEWHVSHYLLAKA